MEFIVLLRLLSECGDSRRRLQLLFCSAHNISTGCQRGPEQNKYVAVFYCRSSPSLCRVCVSLGLCVSPVFLSLGCDLRFLERGWVSTLTRQINRNFPNNSKNKSDWWKFSSQISVFAINITSLGACEWTRRTSTLCLEVFHHAINTCAAARIQTSPQEV